MGRCHSAYINGFDNQRLGPVLCDAAQPLDSWKIIMNLKGSIKVKDLNFYYGAQHALKNISMDVEPHKIVAMIGPSGCGKSTLIRVFNRMNDLIPSSRVEGEVLVDGVNIYDKNTDVVSLRRKVGMV